MNKQALNDLALLGGAPLFETHLHVGRPNLLGQAEILQDIKTIFESHWLTNRGPYLRDFEAELCRQLEVKHCIAVCNGTLGLMLVLKALGLSGEVIVPSFTFPATVHALDWQGLRPVFCDIDPQRHTLDVNHVARLITPQTSAILGVHLWGSTCEVEALQTLAKQHDLKLIFDAAHALACSHNERWVGSFGDAEVFSFHATKFIHSLEGGAITTQSDELAAQLRQWLNFGYDPQAEVRLPGINAKLNEVSAAVGLHGLKHLPEIVQLNRERYAHYAQIFAQVPGLRLYPFDDGEKHNYQYVIVEVDAQRFGLNRDQLWRLLQAEQVLVRRYFYPGCHQMAPYRDLPAELPITEAVCERVMAFPTGTGISAAQIESLGQWLHFVHQHQLELAQHPQVRQS